MQVGLPPPPSSPIGVAVANLVQVASCNCQSVIAAIGRSSRSMIRYFARSTGGRNRIASCISGASSSNRSMI